ncbi:MAG: tetrahydrofolate dehydrogenase/cyclohydrolase catalytic domain-containing protein [Haloferacaceae archaeon]
MTAQNIDGDAVASDVRDEVRETVERLDDAGVTPTLATVLMGSDPASETYVSLKQDDCASVGIETRDVRLDGSASADELYETVAELNDDPSVHGVLVQQPLPEQVDDDEIVRAVDPRKDVDGFHPENLGRLVRGNARYVPCTPLGIQRLLVEADVETEGADVVIVGRSTIVGKPLANRLLARDDHGNATVTVCHSRTDDLESKLRAADIVVAAAGVPELVDGSMLGEGATVVDVGINRVERDGESTLVGDVDYESAREVAGAVTPVPGGVGPMTRAMLLVNTVRAAGLVEGVDVDLAPLC